MPAGQLLSAVRMPCLIGSVVPLYVMAHDAAGPLDSPRDTGYERIPATSGVLVCERDRDHRGHSPVIATLGSPRFRWF